MKPNPGVSAKASASPSQYFEGNRKGEVNELRV